MDAPDLLLKDYEYFADSYWKNELSGETRVNWLIGITTAGVGGLIGLRVNQPNVNPQLLAMIAIGVLILLLFLSVCTMLRLLKRNENTDLYIEGLDQIRTIFRTRLDTQQVLAHYNPFLRVETRSTINYRKIGGLAYFVALLDAGLTASIAIVLIFAYDPEGTFLALASALVIFIGTSALQYIGLRWHEATLKARRVQMSATHAGGILFRVLETGDCEYLLIRPRSLSEEWVFPKGHIEASECPRETAMRELFEETGIVAQVVAPVGQVEFKVNEESVRGEYYLMKLKYETNLGCREKKWMPFRDACQSLTHSDAMDLLKKAEKIRSKS